MFQCAVGINTCCLQKMETSCTFSATVKDACQLLTGEWIGSVRPNMHPIFQNCVHWMRCQQIFWTPFFIVGKLCFTPLNAIRELRAMQNNDSVELLYFLKYRNISTLNGMIIGTFWFFPHCGNHDILRCCPLNNFYFYFNIYYTCLLKVTE